MVLCVWGVEEKGEGEQKTLHPTEALIQVHGMSGKDQPMPKGGECET
jgi:hypothetical protein